MLFIRGESLYRVPTVGGAERKLVDNIGAADWSPDGAHVAWTRNEGGKSTLWTSGVNGEDPRAVATQPRQISKVRWSPDGRAIAGSVQSVVSIVGPETILVAASDGSAREDDFYRGRRLLHFRAGLDRIR